MDFVLQVKAAVFCLLCFLYQFAHIEDGPVVQNQVATLGF